MERNANVQALRFLARCVTGSQINKRHYLLLIEFIPSLYRCCCSLVMRIPGIRERTNTLTPRSPTSAMYFQLEFVSFSRTLRFLLMSQQITIGIWLGL